MRMRRLAGVGEPGSSVAAHLGGSGWSGRLLVAALTVVCAGVLASSAYADRAFTARFSANDTGSITMVAQYPRDVPC